MPVHGLTRLIALALVITASGAGSQASAPAVQGSAYADLPGRRIWYLDTGGNGEPVVFLHAGSGHIGFWEKQIDFFRSHGYRFIAYDRLGSGRSVLDSGASPGSAVDDLDALADHLHLDRFHLVGTAAGGIVALDYVLTHPRRLLSLVVASSTGGVQDESYQALSRRIHPPEFYDLPVEVRELSPGYRAGDSLGTARWVELTRQSRPANPLPSPQQRRNRITFSLLESIRVPTLLMTGGADLYTPAPVLRLFADRIRGAESVVVPDVGHSIWWEAPAVFNETVLAFLTKY